MMQLPSFPKYENFQVTDHKWIGQVPSHWELRTNKYIFSLKKQPVGKRSSDYDLLSLTLRGIIKRDMENPEGKFPAEFDTYQEVSPGDFVFCHFDVEETPRTVGLSDFHGMITGAYTVYRTQKSVDPRFLLYFYLNADNNKKLRSLYTGLRNTISKDAFASFKTPMPPLPEQRTIAAFLDDKCAKIDGAVKIKEDQIALLRERRQIIIQDAVTRGLNPAAPMKDSGIDGLGKVPSHWEIVFNRRLFRENSRKITQDETPLSLSQVDGVIPSEEMKERSLSPSHRNNFKLCLPDDLVVNRFKGHLGVFFRSAYRGIVTFHYGVFEPEKSVSTKYYELLYHTECYKIIYAGASNGMTIGLQNLSNLNFYRIKSPRPPKHEQLAIVNFIVERSRSFDEAISLKENQIAKLNEYKIALINAAVTGKIKVI